MGREVICEWCGGDKRYSGTRRGCRCQNIPDSDRCDLCGQDKKCPSCRSSGTMCGMHTCNPHDVRRRTLAMTAKDSTRESDSD